MHRVLSRVAGIMPASHHSGVTLSALHVLYHHRALPFSPLHTPCSHAASRAGGQPVSFIGYYRCGCLRRRGFTWASGDAGICHAPALNERRRRRRRRRRREPAHRRTAPADSGEAAAAIPSDTTGASHRGANSPPRRCLRSHVFDGLLASKRGTARLGTRTIQQHCINVPSKWTLSLFGWAQRPSHTPTRPSIFASKNPCPLDCPRLCLLASSLLLLPCLGRGALGCGLYSGGGRRGDGKWGTSCQLAEIGGLPAS